MIVKNATVYHPGTEKFTERNIFIKDGVIVDDNFSFNNHFSANDIVDLTNKFLYPSFIDSHCHLVSTGKSKFTLSLDNIHQKTELISQLSCPSQQTIYRGWSFESLSFLPDRSFLDNIDNSRSLLLIRKCGHVGYVNSRFISEFDIGYLDGWDGSSLKKGLLQERALVEAIRKIPLNKQLEKEMFERSAIAYQKKGVSAVHSEDWNLKSFPEYSTFASQQKLIRLHESVCISNKNELHTWISLRQKIKLSPFFNLSHVKLYLDGSLGAKTAFLKKPYQNDHHVGIVYFSSDSLAEIIDIAEHESIGIKIHVIGDGALDIALEAFSKSMHPGNPLRHKLIHVQLASPDQLQRILDLNLLVAIQPSFLTSDQFFAPLLLGEKRYQEIGYPFQKMHSMGINLSFSTDSPIENLNPFTTLASSALWLDRKKAFYYYSIKAAESIFQDNKLGQLSNGSYADGFVLSKNLFTIPQSEISSIVPEMTLFHGQWKKVKEGDLS